MSVPSRWRCDQNQDEDEDDNDDDDDNRFCMCRAGGHKAIMVCTFCMHRVRHSRGSYAIHLNAVAADAGNEMPLHHLHIHNAHEEREQTRIHSRFNILFGKMPQIAPVVARNKNDENGKDIVPPASVYFY